jgi:hypothetical protein
MDSDLEARLQAIELTLAVLVKRNPAAVQELDRLAVGIEAAPVPVADAHLESVARRIRAFAQGSPGQRWSDDPEEQEPG